MNNENRNQIKAAIRHSHTGLPSWQPSHATEHGDKYFQPECNPTCTYCGTKGILEWHLWKETPSARWWRMQWPAASVPPPWLMLRPDVCSPLPLHQQSNEARLPEHSLQMATTSPTQWQGLGDTWSPETLRTMAIGNLKLSKSRNSNECYATEINTNGSWRSRKHPPHPHCGTGVCQWFDSKLCAHLTLIKKNQ